MKKQKNKQKFFPFFYKKNIYICQELITSIWFMDSLDNQILIDFTQKEERKKKKSISKVQIEAAAKAGVSLELSFLFPLESGERANEFGQAIATALTVVFSDVVLFTGIAIDSRHLHFAFLHLLLSQFRPFLLLPHHSHLGRYK